MPNNIIVFNYRWWLKTIYSNSTYTGDGIEYYFIYFPVICH